MLPICSAVLNVGVASESASLGHPASTSLPRFPTQAWSMRNPSITHACSSHHPLGLEVFYSCIVASAYFCIAPSHHTAALVAVLADNVCSDIIHWSDHSTFGCRLFPMGYRGTVVGLLLNSINYLFYCRRNLSEHFLPRWFVPPSIFKRGHLYMFPYRTHSK